MREDVWNLVFANPSRGICVDERTDHFDVEYDSRAEFQEAVVLLDGRIDYQELAV